MFVIIVIKFLISNHRGIHSLLVSLALKSVENEIKNNFNINTFS